MFLFRAERYNPALFIAIGIITLIIYLPSLNAPFYLDDNKSILNNPSIYNWHSFSELWSKLWSFSSLRSIGYASFAANYSLSKFDPFYFHLTNLIIHFLTGVCIYYFTKTTLNTPALDKQYQNHITVNSLKWLAFIVTGVFLIHPLNTQAVTYVVQRLASLAALFYIATLLFYALARNTDNNNKIILFYLLATISFILALFTKQNTYTLPASVLLYEILFYPKSLKKILIITLPCLSLFFLAWFIVAKIYNINPFALDSLLFITQETSDIPRSHYMISQFEILWLYIGKFFYPINLSLVYEQTIRESFFEASVLMALSSHLLLIGLACYYCKRLPIPAFGILFYYLAHSIESSLIPIRDLVFEHRSYLPNIGLCMAIGWFICRLLSSPWKKYAAPVLIICLCILSYITYDRNLDWQNPDKFFTKITKHAPQSPRSWSLLGEHYIKQKKYPEALKALQKSMIVSKNEKNNTFNLQVPVLLKLAFVLDRNGHYKYAIELLDKSIITKPRHDYLSNLYLTRGYIHYLNKKFESAEADYIRSFQTDKNNPNTYARLAEIYYFTKHYTRSDLHLQKALALDPENSIALALRKIKVTQKKAS